MPKRSSKPKKKNQPTDINLLAAQIVEAVTESREVAIVQPRKIKNKAAVALGRRGGRKGGKARAENLTPEKRSEIAKKAAQTRWSRFKRKS